MNLYDTFALDGVRRTADGYLAAFARVARTGIQVYKGSELGRPDLGQVRVYRPPEEVFHEDALKSFAHRPVTLNHPRAPVTSKNWKRYAGGQTGDQVVRDGEFVRVPMVMMDARLIDAYEKNGVKELSMGYSTDLQWRVGVTDAGEPYDAVQTAIRGNHLAVVPAARGGDQLRIGDTDFRKLVSQLDSGEEDDDVNVDDAWSEEARAAALEARRSNAKNTPAGARGPDGHHIVPGGQGQDKAGAVEHPLHRTIMNAGYKYSHSTPIHKMNGDTVMHHTYENGEHKSNPGSSVMDTHKVSIAHGSDKWTTSTGGGTGRQTTGEGQHSLATHLARKSSRYAELKHAAHDSADDYDDDSNDTTTDCPECGAEIPPGSAECPECHYQLTTNDGVTIMPKILVIDGLNVNLVDEQSASIIERHITKLETQVKDASKTATELADAKTALSTKDGEIAVLKKQVTDAAITPAKLDELVKDRLAVIDAAAPLLDAKFVFDGKTVQEIKQATVEAYLGDAAKGMDEGTIAGAFVAATLVKDGKGGGSQPIRDALRVAGGRRSAPVDTRDAAYDEKLKNLSDGWKKKAV